MTVSDDAALLNAPKATRLALRDALGFPALMLLASMTGFGSLARESGLSLAMALGATAGIWGLPGQVAMVELHAAGISAFFVILAASLANARFLPMAVSFLPLLCQEKKTFREMFVLVQLLSINSWAAGLRRFPEISPSARRRYYLVFAATCMTAGLAGTALGFLSVGAMPRPLALGLLFLNPLFFAVLLAGSRGRPAVFALLFGAVLGPVFHLLSPSWGLPAVGLFAGSAAFWLHLRLGSATRRG